VFGGVATTVYWRERGPLRFDQSSIVKMVGSSPGEAIAETHLCMGKARGWLSTELPDRELGYYQDILARGSNED
jgi:hypothetical protein